MLRQDAVKLMLRCFRAMGAKLEDLLYERRRMEADLTYLCKQLLILKKGSYSCFY